jgi:hypothetical protein
MPAMLAMTFLAPRGEFRTGLLAAAVLLHLGMSPCYGEAQAPGPFRELAQNLLGRTVFKTDAGNVGLEIIDLLVGPARTSKPIPLNGGALLDVQGGEAALIVDGKMRRIKPGDVVSLARGQSVIIDNSRARRSLVARLILVSRQDN